MGQFEYKTIFTDAKGFLGGKIDQGWELVSTFASNQSCGATRWIVSVFKRKK